MKKAITIWENDNEDILGSLLETAKSIPEISEYLSKEIIYLKNDISKNCSVIDFGCGDGRHLRSLEETISRGLGVDMNTKYLNSAKNMLTTNKICFVKANIEEYKAEEYFDFSISMYNTLGNISNQEDVIKSMLSSTKTGGKLILSLYSTESISYRISMYKAMGFKNPTLDGNTIIVGNGLFSRHYSKEDIKNLLPSSNIKRCSNIGWYVTHNKI